MSLNQPLLLSSALVHQVLLSPTTYPYKQVSGSNRAGAQTFQILRQEIPSYQGFSLLSTYTRTENTPRRFSETQVFQGFLAPLLVPVCTVIWSDSMRIRCEA